MQFKPIAAIIVLALVVASLLVAGCTFPTTPPPNNTQTDSQLKAFTDAFHENVQKNLGPNETLHTWNETTQGTDVIRVRYSTFNSTPSTFYTNGTTTNMDVKIQKFQSTTDASTFADNQSFGYTPASQSNTSTVNSTDMNAVYNKAIGHDPTAINAYFKIESFTFVTAQVSFVIQVDEFVVYGYASASTSTSVTSSASASIISPTPTPTPPPTPTPTPTSTPTPPCTHVDITIYHPTGVPCNNCASMMGTLGAYYANSPYVTISMQNATSNSVIGIVRETGQTQSLPWGYNTQIEAWTDSVLTCK